jgi:acetolactate synthase-1/2/3 large subunit
MTIQELGTILQYQVGVKIVVLNNNYLGMVRQWQDMFFKQNYAATELVNPDFVMISNAYSIPARKVSKREELQKAVAEMLETESAYLLEITVEKEGGVFPMVEPGSSVSEIRLTY